MAHIDLPEGVPGILGPLQQFPDTAGPLSELAQTLLRGPSPLSPAERELIAAYTSFRNECAFCARSHSAAARHLFGNDSDLVQRVLTDGVDRAPINDKMKALLTIADRVRIDGRHVRSEDIARAREHGATDREIHDTVLIAAAFCMFNRYVDGLATWTPDDEAMYDQQGALLAEHGYVRDRTADQARPRSH